MACRLCGQDAALTETLAASKLAAISSMFIFHLEFMLPACLILIDFGGSRWLQGSDVWESVAACADGVNAPDNTIARSQLAAISSIS